MEVGESSTEQQTIPRIRRIFRRKTEKLPLLTQKRLFQSLSGPGIQSSDSTTNLIDEEDPFRTLGTFAGVFAPVCLSQFSTILFLRVGFIVGSIGLLLSCGTLAVAYLILLFTILSICAISTNGAVEGGGAYYMISRTLGPEFGGAIGALFFFANVFSSALYTTGCVEGLLENFGVESGKMAIAQVLPEGPWMSFAYGSVLNAINMILCFFGAALFAKFTVGILVVVLICTLGVIISFLAVQGVIEVPIPSNNEQYANLTANYTGFSTATFKENLYHPSTVEDYTTGMTVDFATVFSVLFSGVTGIMAGANMSGELKKPAHNIPVGTLLASVFTLSIYLLLFLLTSATCSRFLLQNNYSFMIGIDLWPPFIAVGVVTATISASLSNMIGASRVLAALVKDNIYGVTTQWIGLISVGSNPVGAVLVSGVLTQCVLLIGQLNTIARFSSVFFLLSYMATNVACLSLEWASAPNFRPTFHYFSWWTAALGIITNLALMFVVSPIYSAICIIICLVLIIILHIRSPSEHHKWGSISQALIFHQVRKYLLLLDARKDHVKFWRPQVLLLVADPRSACPLIDFVNDLKKSGLYILGHVKLGEFTGQGPDPASADYPRWQCLVDHLKVKAFIEVTVSPSVRSGMQQLVRVAGLGAMKPNTVVMGFRDDAAPGDLFARDTSPFHVTTMGGPDPPEGSTSNGSSGNTQWLTEWQKAESATHVSSFEYVAMVRDVINMNKNACLCRHFHLLDKEALLRRSTREKSFIDVWPMNFFQPDEGTVFDTSSLFLMQLATVLNMVSRWRKRTRLRVFLCVSSATADPARQKQQVWNMLTELRIHAVVTTVQWGHVAALWKKSRESAPPSASLPPTPPIDASPMSVPPSTECNGASKPWLPMSESYLNGVNGMVRENSINTAVSFMYLPAPPQEMEKFEDYLHALTLMTQHLHPTMLVHGVSAVTTTNL